MAKLLTYDIMWTGLKYTVVVDIYKNDYAISDIYREGMEVPVTLKDRDFDDMVAIFNSRYQTQIMREYF